MDQPPPPSQIVYDHQPAINLNALFYRQQILDNCRLIFPTESNITVATSPAGQYVVSLVPPHSRPKILLDFTTDPTTESATDLFPLYLKTQQRVAEVVSAMKGSVPARKSHKNGSSGGGSGGAGVFTPSSSMASARSSSTSLPPQYSSHMAYAGMPLPFPRFPLQFRSVRDDTSGDGPEFPQGENRCCGHDRELVEERARRKRAERKVKELEAMLRVVMMEGMQAIGEEEDKDDEALVVVESSHSEVMGVREKRLSGERKTREPQLAPLPDRRSGRGPRSGGERDQKGGGGNTKGKQKQMMKDLDVETEDARYAIEILEYP